MFIVTVNKRRPRNYSGILRTYTYKFYLVIFRGNILVCKKFFNTFNISIRIDHILKAHNIPKEMR